MATASFLVMKQAPNENRRFLSFGKLLETQNQWFFDSQVIKKPNSLGAGVINKNWNWWLLTKSNARPNTCVDRMLQKE
jgi:hypothetical protein